MSKAKRPSQKKNKNLQPLTADPLKFANLGNVYLSQGNIKLAVENYCKALALKPDFSEIHNNLGVALQQQGKLEAAMECYQHALSINPNYPDAHQNLGFVFKDLGKFEDSIDCYQQALSLRPNYPDTYCNLGISFKALGKIKEAIDCYRKALSLNFHFAEAQFNLGLALLSTGDFTEGWKQHEARYHPQIRHQNSIALPNFSFPQWQGESIHGKSIVICSEQGLGDEIQFSRYVDILKTQGASHITWVCKKPLKSLLSTLKGVNAVLTEQEAAATISTHDYWTFALSLPLYCNTTLETIPATVPYLYANPNQVQQISAELSHIKALKVGICWKGNPKHKNDLNRTPGIMRFERLFTLPKVRFFTLQPGTREEFMAAAKTAGADMGHEIDETTFEDSAALIANLDLIISCDTSTCHLAGALGKPVWVVLPFEADWRWLRNREDSPWYPNTRLFRQTKAGHWTEVFERVESQLKKLINSSR
jgi:tetratricopeptide (TPR) repeat protein